MKAVNSGAIEKLFEYATEGPEKVIGGFAVAAVRTGEDEANMALVPFGSTDTKAMRTLAEHAIRAINETEGEQNDSN